MCLPCVLPRCCVGSSLSEHLDDSLWRRRTPWTPIPQTLHPRCSRPTSSPPLEAPCGGNHSRTSWMCPRRRSASLQTPRPLMLWHGRTLTLWLLRETDEDRQEDRETESVSVLCWTWTSYYCRHPDRGIERDTSRQKPFNTTFHLWEAHLCTGICHCLKKKTLQVLLLQSVNMVRSVYHHHHHHEEEHTGHMKEPKSRVPAVTSAHCGCVRRA